jgi:hypothetical protein
LVKGIDINDPLEILLYHIESFFCNKLKIIDDIDCDKLTGIIEKFEATKREQKKQKRQKRQEKKDKKDKKDKKGGNKKPISKLLKDPKIYQRLGGAGEYIDSTLLLARYNIIKNVIDEMEPNLATETLFTSFVKLIQDNFKISEELAFDQIYSTVGKIADSLVLSYITNLIQKKVLQIYLSSIEDKADSDNVFEIELPSLDKEFSVTLGTSLNKNYSKKYEKDLLKEDLPKDEPNKKKYEIIDIESSKNSLRCYCYDIRVIEKIHKKNKSLINKPDFIGNTPIFYGIEILNTDVINKLIELGAYISYPKLANRVGYTPLTFFTKDFKNHVSKMAILKGGKLYVAMYKEVEKEILANPSNKNNILNNLDTMLPAVLVMINEYFYNVHNATSYNGNTFGNVVLGHVALDKNPVDRYERIFENKKCQANQIGKLWSTYMKGGPKKNNMYFKDIKEIDDIITKLFNITKSNDSIDDKITQLTSIDAEITPYLDKYKKYKKFIKKYQKQKKYGKKFKEFSIVIDIITFNVKTVICYSMYDAIIKTIYTYLKQIYPDEFVPDLDNNNDEFTKVGGAGIPPNPLYAPADLNKAIDGIIKTTDLKNYITSDVPRLLTRTILNIKTDDSKAQTIETIFENIINILTKNDVIVIDRNSLLIENIKKYILGYYTDVSQAIIPKIKEMVDIYFKHILMDYRYIEMTRIMIKQYKKELDNTQKSKET